MMIDTDKYISYLLLAREGRGEGGGGETNLRAQRSLSFAPRWPGHHRAQSQTQRRDTVTVTVTVTLYGVP
jgi:hypothetical protein